MAFEIKRVAFGSEKIEEETRRALEKRRQSLPLTWRDEWLLRGVKDDDEP